MACSVLQAVVQSHQKESLLEAFLTPTAQKSDTVRFSLRIQAGGSVCLVDTCRRVVSCSDCDAPRSFRGLWHELSQLRVSRRLPVSFGTSDLQLVRSKTGGPRAPAIQMGGPAVPKRTGWSIDRQHCIDFALHPLAVSAFFLVVAGHGDRLARGHPHMTSASLLCGCTSHSRLRALEIGKASLFASCTEFIHPSVPLPVNRVTVSFR